MITDEIINIIENDVRSSEIEPSNENDKKCAPGKIFSNGSCIELDVLIELAKAYNDEHTNKQISLISKLDTLNPKKYKRYLIKELKHNLKDICDDQTCWIKQDFVKRMKNEAQDRLKTRTLRPVGPQGKFTWLDTLNINKVMTQYQDQYNDFKFLGAVPIDFDLLPQLGIKDLDCGKLMKEGINKIGIVFNLDEHYKSGSHWVAAFSDLKEKKIYFSDSYGTRPEPRIRALLRRIARFCSNGTGKDAQIDYNKTQHQQGGSECGVYSINFILRLLKGESFEKISSVRLSDEEVNKCRDVYFRKSK